MSKGDGWMTMSALVAVTIVDLLSVAFPVMVI